MGEMSERAEEAKVEGTYEGEYTCPSPRGTGQPMRVFCLKSRPESEFELVWNPVRPKSGDFTGGKVVTPRGSS